MAKRVGNGLGILTVIVFLWTGCAATHGGVDYSSALSHSDRLAAERELDEVRKPAEVLAFYGVKKGDRVADLLAGRGYYTMILSQIVGPGGVVYSTNSRDREDWASRFKKDSFSNVRLVVGPPDKIGLPQDSSLDFALTHLNYHDLPAPTRMGMNKLIFAALKKGGVYGVADHSAREGSGEADVKTLHRIDKQLVIQEVTAAGFKLADEGKMLARPDDKRDFNVNKVRNQDDRFVLKFVKP